MVHNEKGIAMREGKVRLGWSGEGGEIGGEGMTLLQGLEGT